jgi:hypothetical protein
MRRKLLPLAIGTLCPMCGRVMLEGQALDLDHSVPQRFAGLGRSHGDRIVHRSCNRRGGARITAWLRRNRVRPRGAGPSRAW